MVSVGSRILKLHVEEGLGGGLLKVLYFEPCIRTMMEIYC